MRQIGHLRNERQAASLGGYLLSLGIATQVEQEPDKSWAVWVEDDDQVARAAQELERFLANPDDPLYGAAAKTAVAAMKRAEKTQGKSRYRAVDARTTWGTMASSDYGFLSVGLIVMSVGLFVVQTVVPELKDIYGVFFFDWPLIMQGQVWRALTPIFLHFGLIHIVFNMMWIRGLGTEVELEEGTLTLTLMVLLYGIFGNAIQYMISGPRFGGMSGVVYGLFGYVWIRGMYDPNASYRMDRNTAAMMIGWFLLGFTGWMPIANGAHAGGFIAGIVWAAVRVRRIPFTSIRF